MARLAPLPFRIKLPGEESVNLTEVRDISRRAEGLLHLFDDAVLLEWAVTEAVEEVGLSGVSSNTDTFAREELEVPLSWIAGAELVGGILLPRLVLRAHALSVFEEVPGAKADRLELRYARRDRMVAVAMLHALTAALDALPATDEVPEITPGAFRPGE
ncbi:MAG TPA: hypothetical protein PLI93_11675 [Gemmatimonadales bacterium]|nr:hypothetical protein [Gemmatimonadales bacterium]